MVVKLEENWNVYNRAKDNKNVIQYNMLKNKYWNKHKIERIKQSNHTFQNDT